MIIMQSTSLKNQEKAFNWSIKGNWYETCASEGHCPHYFARDREKPCFSFNLFHIKEGRIGEVDISGTKMLNSAELLSEKFADLPVKGGEGGIYFDSDRSEEQRKVLEPFWRKNIPGCLLVKNVLGVKFVDIEFTQNNGVCNIKMPYGEIQMSLAPGLDGENPQRLENSLFGMFFSDIKIANTHFWKYSDYGKNREYKNRSGVIAEFDLKGTSTDIL